MPPLPDKLQGLDTADMSPMSWSQDAYDAWDRILGAVDEVSILSPINRHECRVPTPTPSTPPHPRRLQKTKHNNR